VRAALRSALPFASSRQPNIAHVSLGRILDPIDGEAFSKLKELVSISRNEEYGVLHVSEVKYIHETKWYMEEKEVVEIFPLS
jgi:hypothetical protein